uniref:Gar1 protein RNA binding region protein n=3 Tax=Toxoplasma gondii TaxID=5811 RepID=A0A2T6J3T9_TOXGO|nr:Gar1 protein RNA binding region protein [Toxoplasma gondii TgCATBr9]
MQPWRRRRTGSWRLQQRVVMARGAFLGAFWRQAEGMASSGKVVRKISENKEARSLAKKHASEAVFWSVVWGSFDGLRCAPLLVRHVLSDLSRPLCSEEAAFFSAVAS